MADLQTDNKQGSMGWLIGGAVALAGIVALNLSRLSRFSQNFILDVAVQVLPGTKFPDLKLGIMVTFKNPTDATVTIKHPTVYIYDQNPTPVLANGKATGNLPEPLLTTRVEGKQYTIRPNDQTVVGPIQLDLSLANLGLIVKLGTLLYNVSTKPASWAGTTLYARSITQVNGVLPIETPVRSFTIRSAKYYFAQFKTQTVN